MKRILLTFITGLLVFSATHAQEEPKLVVKPSGRILMDAGVFSARHSNDQLKSGVGIPDMRVGVGFTYGQWKGKVDMGYASGKVNLKDVWMQYDFNKEQFIRGGYFIHQYGLQSCTSSSFKESMEEPSSNQVFNNNRMIGLMYEYNGSNVLATASAVVETDWDFYDFYESVIVGQPEPLRKEKTAVRIVPAKTYDSVEVFARETVWFGRRRGATMLHGKETEKIEGNRPA